MCTALVHDEVLAEFHEQVVGGVEPEAEVDEKLHEFAQFVENEVLILLIELLLLLLELQGMLGGLRLLGND